MTKNRVFRSLAFFGLLGAAVALVGLTQGAPQSAEAADGGRLAHATVRDVNGTALGTINLVQDRGKIAVSGRLTGIAPGFHGFHVHSVGICDPRATDATGAVVPFASAGPHLNPGGVGHGGHAGDLPLLYVAADGTTITTTSTDRLTAALLFDTDRSAIIVHAAADNYANIPTRYSAAGVPGPDAATLGTGDAGARFACGIVNRG
ncbi:MAG TPA: superoxide dismutase family protein [Actinophytocola sp.]|uniref:superoxide dismutase family protein n=1 Tax=Actinophytocola sp. TaxID=1872138 RepID=UPI002DBA55EF|nr:superoxide dismutase family protein [Actinophytocola sp.]HEU5470129.1 superoxide dismutase family protein [Actinophytocola sp.]